MPEPFEVIPHGYLYEIKFPSGRQLFVAPDYTAEAWFIHDGAGQTIWDGFSEPEHAFDWLEEQERMFPEIPLLEPVRTEVRMPTSPELVGERKDRAA